MSHAARIVTLGHSNRTVAQLLELLRAHEIELLVDIRRVPKSGRNPHFNADALAIDLPRDGIAYRSVPELGGRRSRAKNTPHIGLTDPSIAGYADYMDTSAFADAVAALIDDAGGTRTAIMCAEAKPETCHRRLLSDWLSANGVEVVHAVDETAPMTHAMTPCARIDNGRVVYDRGQLPLLG
jgi:uncharacterized protein (DUF488 family)